MTTKKQQPTTRNDYIRLGYLYAAGSTSGFSYALSLVLSIPEPIRVGLWAGSLVTGVVTFRELFGDDVSRALDYKAKTAQGKRKGQASAVLVHAPPESPKGDDREILLNGNPRKLESFEFALPGGGFVRLPKLFSGSAPASRSITKQNYNVVGIQGDKSRPDSPYRIEGKTPISLLRRMLREADPPPRYNKQGKLILDRGQYLSHNTLVKKSKRYTEGDYWLLIRVIVAAGKFIGEDFLESPNPEQKWKRLRFPWRWTYETTLRYLKHKEGFSIPVWPPAPLPRVPNATSEAAPATRGSNVK